MIIKKFSMKYYNDALQIWKASGISVGSSDEREEIKRVLRKNSDLFLVGLIEKKVIAVVIGAFDGRRGYVHHLAVDPEYQNKGYGRLMMEELHHRFKLKDVKKVHLFIEVDNVGVKEFYLKMGWHVRDDLMMMSYVP